MPADAEFVVLDAKINLKQWNKAIAEMEKDAKAIEKLFAAPLTVKIKVDDSGLNQAKGALNDLDAGVTAEVRFDITGDNIAAIREEWDDPLKAKVDFDQVGDDIAGLRDKWDDPLKARVDFVATGDESVATLRDLLDDTIDVDVKFKTSGVDIGAIATDLEGISDETVNVKFTTSGVDVAKIAGDLSGIQDETVTISMDKDSSIDSTITDINTKLDALNARAKIQLTLDTLGFVKGLADIPLVGQLIEIEELTNRVIGQTGRDLEDVGRTINNVWTSNWGESKEEIAGVITTVAQMRDANEEFMVSAGNIEGVVTGAFQAASVGGEDTLTVLLAASQLMKGGFTTDFQDAFDFIALGFSQGLNQSDDFLDTIIEYTTTFEDAELGANAFFNIIADSMALGVFNTDKGADAFKEMFNLTKEEMANFIKDADDMTDRVEALQEIGQLDEATLFAAGEITGEEFAQGVLDKINELFEDPIQQDRIAKAIFSPTMVEDAGLGNLLQIDLMAANLWSGQAKLLSDEIFSGPGSAFQTMQRTLETHFLNALMNSVEAQEFMDKVTIAAQRFGSELAAGADIGAALEVAFELPGLSEKFDQLEVILGNFVISLLQAAVTIGDAMGANTEGLKETIAQFGAGQLAFDLKVATNEQEIEDAVKRAIGRGVSGADTTSAVSTAVTELLEEGNVSQAQELVNTLSEIPDIQLGEKASVVLAAAGDDIDIAIAALEQARTDLEASMLLGGGIVGQLGLAEFDTAIEELQAKFSEVDTQVLQGQVNTYVAALNAEMQTAFTSGDFDLVKMLGDQLGIENIDQIIGEQKAQSLMEGIFPAPTQEEVNTKAAELFGSLTTALAEGDFETGAGIAAQLLDADDPNVVSLVDDFATTLLINFNNALATGDVDTAANIMGILGLSADDNELVLSSMETRLSDFVLEGGTQIDLIEEEFVDLGDQMTETSEKGVDDIDSLFGAILSDKGVLGITRLNTIIKRFDAVAASIAASIKAIDEADEKTGGNASAGMQVGGVGSAGVTMVGEAGRELIFADERFAVLNNQTTDRLFSALSSMGGGGNTNNTRNVTVNQNINVQNSAQASLFGGASLDQLRGEAF